MVPYISGEAQMDPAPWMIVYSTLWRLFPAVGGLLRLVEKFPTREQTRLRQFNDTSKATALDIVNKAIQEEVSGAVQKGEKDIVGLLGKRLAIRLIPLIHDRILSIERSDDGRQEENGPG